MTVLPEAFKERMRLILGSEYEAFAQSFENERVQGLRFNTLKAGLEKEKLSCSSMFRLRPVPWCREGYYYDAKTHPGAHPYHEAGLYYIQEPSAMAAVELMDVKPGEKILDLCAAPGGKSTQIGAKLKGEGLLVANEIHPARAKILCRNIERMGITNAVVTQEDPKKLSAHFPEFFDRILADSPCSGEGMFRKDEDAITQWSEENVLRCALRDQEILDAAAAMLKPGGSLLYSTCTFETEEDEGAVLRFLKTHKEFSLADDPKLPGFSEFSACSLPGSAMTGAMYRLWPHEIEGEGHFIALLKKSPDAGNISSHRKNKKNTASASLKERELITLADEGLCAIFKDNRFKDTVTDRFAMHANELFCIPEDSPSLDGLNVLRWGLCIGSIRKGRFEPSHALALSSPVNDARTALSLKADSDEIRRYLRGETLALGDVENGWVLVCADEYPLGWGKAVNGTLKNHYPKGLRKAH